ncbi:MAG: hypothetical protein EXR52_05540 [Dehalococcoidia bacterium]|nr:hypothetical protein [Dehalococcoidia bacterium]
MDHSDVEAVMQLCATAGSLAQERKAVRDLFFGTQDPQPVKYLPSVGEEPGRERRFLAWFAFQYRLPEGDTPAMRLATSMMPAPIDRAAQAVFSGARFVTAAVTKLRPRKGFVLQSGSERFSVEFPAMADRLHENELVVTGVLPIAGGWLMTPGWVSLGVVVGRGLRKTLGQTIWDPVAFERFLQGRAQDGAQPENEAPPPPPIPSDDSLAAAVRRMSKYAKAQGQPGLVQPTAVWRAAMQPHLHRTDFDGMVDAVLGKAFYRYCPLEELNLWLALLTNIWNNTPQPDRGGKSANQLMRERAANPPEPGEAPTIRLDIRSRQRGPQRRLGR